MPTSLQMTEWFLQGEINNSTRASNLDFEFVENGLSDCEQTLTVSIQYLNGSTFPRTKNLILCKICETSFQ